MLVRLRGRADLVCGGASRSESVHGPRGRNRMREGGRDAPAMMRIQRTEGRQT